MVNLTIEKICEIMKKRNNIRNISIIAQVDHGKSTLTDNLIYETGIIAYIPLKDRFLRSDEIITMAKSTSISLYYELCEEKLPRTSDGNTFFINLIDSPGNVEFSSEVTAALRVSDGALVLVDIIEGVCVQTETVLRQALTERVKPILLLNKIDRLFLELNLDGEECFRSFYSTIETVNGIISTYRDELLGNLCVFPDKGTVAFGSGLHGWGFTLSKFADLYSNKFAIDREKLMARLWGDNYYDPSDKKWKNTGINEDGKTLKRGFVTFVLEPIRQIYDVIMKDQKERCERILRALKIELKSDEKDLTGKALLKYVMKKFLPVSEAILEMIVIYLPSPVVAQTYRVECLYEGPKDDEVATAIRNCDPSGPLMFYVSKMIPSNIRRKFIAFGRVFAGTACTGQKVRIMGPNYVYGRNVDLYTKVIPQMVFMVGRMVSPIAVVPAGNTVGIVGIDQFILTSTTLSTSETAYPFLSMKFSVSPAVRIAVEPKNVKDLPILVEGLKYLSKLDPIVLSSFLESGEYVISGSGELHLANRLRDLEKFCQIPLKTSDLIVSYRETVTTVSSITCLAKSPNKHNRLYMTAKPFPKGLAEAIDSGVVSHRDDPRVRAHLLSERFKWDPYEAKNIWCFGPETLGPNLLIDTTMVVQYLNEIKDSCVAAFQWATKEGVLCEEECRGICWNINDVTLHTDAIHRGCGQIIPTAKRCLYSCVLTASPRLMEPINLVEILSTENAMDSVHSLLNKKQGFIISEEKRLGMSLYIIKAYLPVKESFSFAEDLKFHTSGQAFSHYVFDHWKIIPGDPLDPNSVAGSAVITTRKRKGFKDDIPSLDFYLDKL